MANGNFGKVLKNGRATLLDCDGQKLGLVLRMNGYMPSTASKKLNYNDGYLGRCINSNKISVVAVQLLEARLGIRPEEYDVKTVDTLANETETPTRAVELATASSEAVGDTGDKITVNFTVTMGADEIIGLIRRSFAEGMNVFAGGKNDGKR